ncbi:MAG: GntR family transcriptional regulator [Deltaproteobacteria bacterium]|nr:GntR family transcriptional regulator [Deltaproteobacteria bacterium]
MPRLPGEREIPQYQKLAETIRGRVVSGAYRSGEKIPSEAALCKSSGLSLLTVRQALGVLVDEGLLERFPGRGTFVTELCWRKAAFNVAGLDDLVSTPDFRAQIVRAEVARASAEVAANLHVSPKAPVGYVKRAFFAGGAACFMVQEGYVILDPRRPVIEAELAPTFLKGIFQGQGQGLVRAVAMDVLPLALREENASLLSREEGEVAFQLKYVFYDFNSQPIACGFFLAPSNVLRLSATLGAPLPPKEEPLTPQCPTEPNF